MKELDISDRKECSLFPMDSADAHLCLDILQMFLIYLSNYKS